MKTFRFVGLVFVAILMCVNFISCNDEYDDSILNNRIDDLENRVYKLEELCSQMNTNIGSLQSLINVLQDRDYITNVTPITKENETIGYTITFAKNNPITIYHGQNGTNGLDGTNGIDGSTPIIGIKKHTDGGYYWTLNNEWLLDEDGNKIRANGQDGANGSNGNDGSNGTNGNDGITPKLKIENSYWYVSYDNETSWIKLEKATGKDGNDGDNIFKDIEVKGGYVFFTLNDKDNTKISIPLHAFETLSLHIQEAGTLKELLTNEQKRTTLSLKLTGNINENDMKTINAQFLVLEKLDLKEVTYVGYSSFSVNPYGTSLLNRTLKEVILPPNGFDGLYRICCLNLENLIVNSAFQWENTDFELCDNLKSLVFTEGIEYIEDYSCSFFPNVDFPKTTNKVSYKALTKKGPQKPAGEKVICRATTPPEVGYIDTNGKFVITTLYDHYKSLLEYTLYVPTESLELYKNDNAWKEFGKILPLSD